MNIALPLVTIGVFILIFFLVGSTSPLKVPLIIIFIVLSIWLAIASVHGGGGGPPGV